jgi:hypothetical protein
VAEIVNLRMARKAKARAEAEAAAQANRAKHGRGKAEKRIAADERARIEKRLEGAKLEE